MPAFSVDEEISKLEVLYKQLTGLAPKLGPTPYAPIPPEADPVNFIQQNLQRLYQVATNSGVAAGPSVPAMTVAPRVNVFENDKEWICHIDIPGVAKSDVALNIGGGVLRLSTTRKGPGDASLKAVHCESAPCRFERAIPVPTQVKSDSVEARLEHGVLSVRLVKEPAVVRREIQLS
jgi:HSP20 family protein